MKTHLYLRVDTYRKISALMMLTTDIANVKKFVGQIE